MSYSNDEYGPGVGQGVPASDYEEPADDEYDYMWDHVYRMDLAEYPDGDF